MKFRSSRKFISIVSAVVAVAGGALFFTNGQGGFNLPKLPSFSGFGSGVVEGLPATVVEHVADEGSGFRLTVVRANGEPVEPNGVGTSPLSEWTSALAGSQQLTLLQNQGYDVAYSETLKNPLLVRYVLDWSKASDEPMKRPKVPFQTDDRTVSKIRTDDYTGMGYDRGHMAPSFAIGKFHGRDAQIGTFVMSNITPQTHFVNDGVWNAIERMVADDFAKRFGVVEVVDGPLFDGAPKTFPAGVAVSYAQYKAIRRPDGEVIGFIVPQEPQSPNPEDYLASPDAIEKASGLLLFPGMVSLEEKARVRTKIW